MANERLRAALLERGKSIEDLAEAVKVDPKTVERWITRSRTPYRKHRYAVASMLGVEEGYLWPEALSAEQAASVAESEIVTVYPHRWAVPRDAWGRLFAEASEEIGILVYSGTFLVDDAGIMHALAEQAAAGVRVRVLLGDPDSPYVAQRGTDEGVGGDNMAGRIRNAIELCRPLHATDGAEVRLHATTLYNSIYRGDDQLLVNTHIYGQRAPNAPVLHLRKVPGADLVTTYTASFDHVWNDAKPLPS